MFDNPNEELQKLEQQLLAAEEKGEDFESFYQDILSEFGPGAPSQSPRKSAPAQKQTHSANAKKKPAGKSKKKKKKKSLKGLVITLCLECVGILGIILWWLLRML